MRLLSKWSMRLKSPVAAMFVIILSWCWCIEWCHRVYIHGLLLTVWPGTVMTGHRGTSRVLCSTTMRLLIDHWLDVTTSRLIQTTSRLLNTNHFWDNSTANQLMKLLIDHRFVGTTSRLVGTNYFLDNTTTTELLAGYDIIRYNNWLIFNIISHP